MLRTFKDLMKENGFKLAKERSRSYPAQIIIDVDYVDDMVLLAKIPSRAESLLHSLEWAAGGIDLHVNADKTEYMCFKQPTSKRRHLHTKRWSSETSGQFHLPRKHCLINWEWYQYAISKGMISYRYTLGHMEVRPYWLNKTFFSKQLSCRYCDMDALHGR